MVLPIELTQIVDRERLSTAEWPSKETKVVQGAVRNQPVIQLLRPHMQRCRDGSLYTGLLPPTLRECNKNHLSELSSG